MKYFYKIENQFLLLAIISLILLFIFKNSFWEYLSVPIGNKHSAFNDLVMVKQWSRFFEYYNDTEYVYTNIDLAQMNYPKVWILIAKLIEKEIFFYCFLFLSFGIYVYIFYIFIKKFNSYFFLYLFFSGPSLLALQRGNVDTLIFILLSFVLITNNLFLKRLLFLISVVLKIFPVFAIQYFLLIKKNFIKTLLLAFACLIYFYLIKDQLTHMMKNGPNSPDMSYGSEVVTLNLKKYYNISFNHIYLSSFLILSSISAYFLFFKKILLNEMYKHQDYFSLGSGIFIFTFLITPSHDYRLIFLFFCVPLLLNLKSKILKYTSLISLVFAMELSRLIELFAFWGGATNIFFKIIIFYLTCIICLDIFLKFSKNHSNSSW